MLSVKLDKNYLDKSIKAMQELLGFYMAGTEMETACPLCAVVIREKDTYKDYDGDVCDCTICPWVIITGDRCPNDINSADIKNDDAECSERIAELGRWLEFYKTIKNFIPTDRFLLVRDGDYIAIGWICYDKIAVAVFDSAIEDMDIILIGEPVRTCLFGGVNYMEEKCKQAINNTKKVCTTKKTTEAIKHIYEVDWNSLDDRIRIFLEGGVDDAVEKLNTAMNEETLSSSIWNFRPDITDIKLTDIPKQFRADTIEVMQELYDYYSFKNDKFNNPTKCPLCDLAEGIGQKVQNNNVVNKCSYCPWYIIEKTGCHNYYHKLFNGMHNPDDDLTLSRAKRNKLWCAVRRCMLQEWIRKYIRSLEDGN
jgi:hypothetical protein